MPRRIRRARFSRPAPVTVAVLGHPHGRRKDARQTRHGRRVPAILNQQKLTFVPVETLDEVLATALRPADGVNMFDAQERCRAIVVTNDEPVV